MAAAGWGAPPPGPPYLPSLPTGRLRHLHSAPLSPCTFHQRCGSRARRRGTRTCRAGSSGRQRTAGVGGKGRREWDDGEAGQESGGGREASTGQPWLATQRKHQAVGTPGMLQRPLVRQLFQAAVLVRCCPPVHRRPSSPKDVGIEANAGKVEQEQTPREAAVSRAHLRQLKAALDGLRKPEEGGGICG